MITYMEMALITGLLAIFGVLAGVAIYWLNQLFSFILKEAKLQRDDMKRRQEEFDADFERTKQKIRSNSKF